MLTEKEHEIRKEARLGRNYIYPWVGVDLDKTLAEYHEFIDHTSIGQPIEPMVNLVNDYLRKGVAVKIFTARVSEPDPRKKIAAIDAIEKWCLKVFDRTLPITCIKDYGCIRIYDDRAVQVEPNTGRIIGEVEL